MTYANNLIDKYNNFIFKNNAFNGLNRYCNICGFRFSKFKQFNRLHPREAQCPICGSLERHRHLAIHLFSIYPFLKNKKILHFAPEAIIKKILSSSECEYYDCDLNPQNATYVSDITNIKFPDNYFDYIICIHILEHIVDDIKAMCELYRVLKPGGIAYLDVPFTSKLKEDYSLIPIEGEDKEIAKEKSRERERVFGQHDHVRYYDQMTFISRLENVGFSTDVSCSKNFPSLFSDALLGSNIIFGKKQIYNTRRYNFMQYVKSYKKYIFNNKK